MRYLSHAKQFEYIDFTRERLAIYQTFTPHYRRFAVSLAITADSYEGDRDSELIVISVPG